MSKKRFDWGDLAATFTVTSLIWGMLVLCLSPGPPKPERSPQDYQYSLLIGQQKLVRDKWSELGLGPYDTLWVTKYTRWGTYEKNGERMTLEQFGEFVLKVAKEKP